MESETKTIDTQASEWFSLIALGEPTPKEHAQFEQWLQASPAHQNAYQSFDLLWDQIGDLPESAFQGCVASEKAPAYDTQAYSSQTCSSQTKANSWIHSLAAFLQSTFSPMSGAITASLLVGFVFVLSKVMTVTDIPTGERYYTELGQIKTVALADGSQITLSAQSEIRVQLKAEGRYVELLKGQAYFDIASQYRANGSKLPFDIQAGALHIQVLGTEFDVQKYAHKTTVSVVEGRVKVSTISTKKQGSKPADNTMRILSEGQRVASIGPRKAKQGGDLSLGPVEAINSASIASWRHGRLTYLDATLADVISDARRFHAGNITLTDAHLADLRITTSFGVDEIENLALILESILPVKVYFGDHGRILITSKQPT